LTLISTRICTGLIKNVIKIINALREIEINTVTGKPEDKKLLGRSRHRRKNNIKMDLKEISCEDVFWIHVPQNWVRWRPTVVSCSSETKHDKGKAPRPKLCFEEEIIRTKAIIQKEIVLGSRPNETFNAVRKVNIIKEFPCFKNKFVACQVLPRLSSKLNYFWSTAVLNQGYEFDFHSLHLRKLFVTSLVLGVFFVKSATVQYLHSTLAETSGLQINN
jgi:hypothetical protein